MSSDQSTQKLESNKMEACDLCETVASNLIYGKRANFCECSKGLKVCNECSINFRCRWDADWGPMYHCNNICQNKQDSLSDDHDCCECGKNVFN